MEGSGKEKENATGRLNVPPLTPRPGTSEKDRMGDNDATKDTADREGESGDAPRFVPTPEDLHLREVYRDLVHRNPGTHLDGRITDDWVWQEWWRDLAVIPS